jgi:predicted RNase H-like HicB family nuclease
METDINKILNKPYHRVLIYNDKTPGNRYWVTALILEFQGCISEGYSVKNALENLEFVAEGWLETCIEKGLEIPEPLESVWGKRGIL